MPKNDGGSVDKSGGDPERCRFCGSKPKTTLCSFEERLQRDAMPKERKK